MDTRSLYINMEGETLERLTNNPQDEKDPIFSADGKKIIYSGEVMSADDRNPGRDLYEVSLTEKEPHRLLVLNGEEREAGIASGWIASLREGTGMIRDIWVTTFIVGKPRSNRWRI